MSNFSPAAVQIEQVGLIWRLEACGLESRTLLGAQPSNRTPVVKK